MKATVFHISWILILVLFGCSLRELTPDAYMNWAQNRSLERTIGDYRFSLMHMPSEMMVLRQQGEDAPGHPEWNGWVDAHSGSQYYAFRIGLAEKSGALLKHNISGPGEYQDKVYHFAFGMQREIYLLDGLDTLKCTLYHFERSYDLAPFVTCMLAFDRTEEIRDQVFVYEDSRLGTGPIRIGIPAGLLRETPSVTPSN